MSQKTGMQADWSGIEEAVQLYWRIINKAYRHE